MIFIGKIHEFIELETLDENSCSIFSSPKEGSLIVLWFLTNNNEFLIDGKTYYFKKNQVVFLTEFHKVIVVKKGKVNFLRFNRPFYCVVDHDKEVSCKGLLFFGASQLPIINVCHKNLEHFKTLWKNFAIEIEYQDNLQKEMLQMMLKRYLILCARLYKEQQNLTKNTDELDVIREFNFLVEQYFKTKHKVVDYASMLYKSPKTISNIFAKQHSKSPLKYIQERITLEAIRLLCYNDISIKEVAFELGFRDVQTFSRFFKKQEGVSPSIYRENCGSGIIANT
ncbi:helix-turn-helix domain-containing protein [Tenacibaculum sp. ZS6-P6]|uniref:helix-turn-helix domain-containing protein n=1 Tax=Tenacibaculum sp. ZS6-P6 TaxID=3447503 RepID=UPI003F95E2B4